uniref:Replication factor A C-terminal domain-containing protein n=1 Tax=Brassica oleracea var. oleracea TaxID=109376 RepID=A0A0D3CRM6_BRAOL
MAITRIFFSDLKSGGKYSSVIEARSGQRDSSANVQVHLNQVVHSRRSVGVSLLFKLPDNMNRLMQHLFQAGISSSEPSGSFAARIKMWAGRSIRPKFARTEAMHVCFVRCATQGRITRLLRYWEARNLKHGGDLMWVDMLMVDVSATIMQATIYANRIPRFRSKLASGKMYSISGFDVARCAQNYRLSKSPLLIRFNDLTDFDELTEPVSPLPEKGFRFSNQSELAGLANPNAQLPEYCERYSWRQELATIKLDNETTVTLSLFDAQAVSFHKKLEDMHGDPRVLVTMDTMSKTRSNEVITNIDLLNELKDGGLTVDAELARLKEMEGDCEESTNKERTR